MRGRKTTTVWRWGLAFASLTAPGPPVLQGLTAERGRDDRWGFIDKKGRVVIPMTFEMVRSFHEGLAAVRRDGKWGYVDRTGMAIRPRFVAAFDFEHGLAKVAVKLKNPKPGQEDWAWIAYIDRTGRVVIQTDIAYTEF